ncbi:50S ribosomal protein L29 [Alphaproteobacteria bacterium]
MAEEVKVKNLRGHSLQELHVMLVDFKKEAMNLRFQHKLASGDFDLNRFRFLKARVAQLMTVINEKKREN